MCCCFFPFTSQVSDLNNFNIFGKFKVHTVCKETKVGENDLVLTFLIIIQISLFQFLLKCSIVTPLPFTSVYFLLLFSDIETVFVH